MPRSRSRRQRRPISGGWNTGPRRRWRPRSRMRGCLLWLVVLIVVLVVVALLFSGFQKGTKPNGLPRPAAPAAVAFS